MSLQLHERVRAALPREKAVRAALAALPDGVWVEAACELHPNLPDFEVVLTAEGVGGAFAQTLGLLGDAEVAVARRGPHPLDEGPRLSSEHWTVGRRPLSGKNHALIAAPLLDDGVPELELAQLARSVGLQLSVAACALEFTSRAARSRLDMLGVTVIALTQLAHTPGGLQFERRGAGGNLLVPMP